MRPLLRRIRGWVDLEQGSLEKALLTAAPRASGRMLDVGCGDKPYELIFQPFVCEHLGVDFVPTYQGSENANRNRADQLYEGDVLPFADREFDTVLCTQVLEHTPRPELLVAECARVLKTNGRLIVTVPFSFRIHSEPFDFYRFTKYGLSTLAASKGLEVELLISRGGFWWVLGQKLASHLVLHLGRMGATVQEVGGLTYEQPVKKRPRYWVLPLVIPMVFLTVGVARFLEWVDPDETDTLGYLLIARRLN